MIKILQKPTKHKVECWECGALLLYEDEDIQIKEKADIETGFLKVTKKWIECPCCKSKISVDEIVSR